MSDQNPLKAGSLRYKALLDEALDLHVRKNTGYAGQNPDAFSNFRLAEGMGLSAVQGVLVRMGDKFARIQSLAKNPENDKVGESMRDTLMDLSAYALIAICLMEEAAEPDGPLPRHTSWSFWYDENGDRRKEVLDSASDDLFAVSDAPKPGDGSDCAEGLACVDHRVCGYRHPNCATCRVFLHDHRELPEIC